MRIRPQFCIAFALLIAGCATTDESPTSKRIDVTKAGDDVFDSNAEVHLVIEASNGLGLPALDETIMLRSSDDAPARVTRQALSDGQIRTEMVSLQLSGASSIGEIHVRAGREFDLPPSPGVITNVETDDDGGFISGDSTFDINVVIEIGGITLSNCQSLAEGVCDDPIRLGKKEIKDLPPKAEYDPGSPDPIPIYGPGGVIVGFIVHTTHITERGCCQLAGPSCSEPPRRDCEAAGGTYIRGGSCTRSTGQCVVPPGP